jgi:thioredoxin 1
MAIKDVASAEFDQVVVQESNNQPVVVDFWAPWCGPCRMIAPLIEELDGEYQGKIVFTKVNTDENQDIASRFNVMSIPTLIIFKGGDVAETVIGVKSKAALKKMFDEHLGD